MSPLTKLFVVLLVISSLLLSASIVVFVNRAENFAVADKELNRRLGVEKQQIAALTYQLGAAQQQLLNQSKDASTREASLRSDLLAADAKMIEKDTANAQLARDAQVKDATVKGTADALRAAQDENKGLQTLAEALRTKNDDLLKQNGELNTQLTTYDNKLRAVDRAREYAEEKNVEKDNTIKQLQQRAGTAAADNKSEGTASPGPINGVVRSVDIIGGKKYATISVGSADNVTKGMKFNVINKSSGEFLGFLTVESVEPNAAIGQVEGKLEKIQPNVEVKTQL